MAKKKKGGRRGKRRGPPSAPPVVTRVKFPNRRMGEMFGRIVGIFGNDRMEVFCEDGKHRIGRIRGKIKKRVWIRLTDLVVVNPWDWETQTDDKMGKCEISWRYLRHEVSWLERNRRIPEILDINKIPL
ncbi:hypothetical protein LCGC14_0690780 [marine sediment metagenome]|uniref:S1-like domain-containing protein n=1 Tax=marine sediment metagenome TaxID=412755 RepID=A0A0F9TTG0_9ZZZZ|nr:translation initiation factor 1A [archaeon]